MYAMCGDEYLVMPCLVPQHSEGHVVRPGHQAKIY